MAPARSLHEIITGLTGEAGTSDDLAAALHAGGYPDLPQDLLAEAVVSFAHTAPAEIAEQLAPFVMAHGPIAHGDTTAGDIGRLPDLLAAARAAEPDGGSVLEIPEIDPPADTGDVGAADLLDEEGSASTDAPAGPWSDLPDTAFGHGADHDRTEPADDVALDAVTPPAGYADARQPSALDDPAVLDEEPDPGADPWVVLSVSDEAPEIDDIDDI
ncbi:hypothetical protein DMB66_19485 [Actinoplanes sp. ATCC 53533]|uniref:hypothetical protein n=1 Tax=Actinoplanes sp. ATCC 53533 TaxID=1288362 RepID=UPI000F784314|nr:hypothetical protein [Actinoplanes sp. ATCC 53533]RSM64513.1 hypothetical protein DMB66_19485 [Actinoplanes sp. ATCC 53533]